MTVRDKIQHLLITHLLKEGKVELALPDGMTLELGITQEGKHGPEKQDNYCWVVASHKNRTVSMDSYNLGLEIRDNRMVLEEDIIDLYGEPLKILEVV